MIPFWVREGGPTDEIVIREIFQENVYRVIRSDVADGVVFDFGANIGAFSVYAASLGAARVIAVEPEPENYQGLRLNARTYIQIHSHEFALWDSEGVQRLFPSHGGTRITPDGPIVVATKTLERLFVDEHIERCRVLKMDVESAEYPIFRVTPSEILARIDYITMEFHSTDATTFGGLISKLSQTHAVQTLGSYERGGYIYARRY